MKKGVISLVLLLFMSSSLISCREVESDAEEIEEVEVDTESAEDEVIEE